jgi:hypothetical protein
MKLGSKKGEYLRLNYLESPDFRVFRYVGEDVAGLKTRIRGDAEQRQFIPPDFFPAGFNENIFVIQCQGFIIKHPK